MQTVKVLEGPLEKTVDATGEVAPLNRVEIKPPLAGRIEQILVDEGSQVKAGQILAWMSSNDRAAILDAARAKGMEEVKKWEDSYKPTPLVAPLSGVIILRNAVVGQTVDAGTILFAMSDKLIVLTYVDEVDIGRIKIGMPARINLDAFPDRPVRGHVTHILYEGKNVSNVITYGVKIQPESIPPFFRSQMTANVQLLLESKDNVLVVPLAALQESQGQTLVLVPGSKGKPDLKPVQVGLKTDESAEIISGLSAGDVVLIGSGRYAPQKEGGSNPLMMSRRRRS
ncbi:MAG: Multidrug resistance protein MdtA [Elusimicrobia bacterium]|nr:Multidrug resistance protein MdtA [Elusimicrobiota bacterium]